jgi:hypothetical protein
MNLKTLVYPCDKNLASPIDLGIPLLPLHAVSAKPPRQNITHPIKTGTYVFNDFLWGVCPSRKCKGKDDLEFKVK